VTSYICPDDPTDPEAAALELIVCMPSDFMHADATVTQALQDYAGALDVESCFSGLSWVDCKPIAAMICFDVTQRDDAADFMRGRARNAMSGVDGLPWADRQGAARALNIAAAVLGL
jgi:hypothetical protein